MEWEAAAHLKQRTDGLQKEIKGARNKGGLEPCDPGSYLSSSNNPLE
jgi:hypothetical protein